MFIYLALKKYQNSFNKIKENYISVDEDDKISNNYSYLQEWKGQLIKNLALCLFIIIVHYFFLVPIAIHYIIKIIKNRYLMILLICLCFLPFTGGPLGILMIILGIYYNH
jgi:hypothetical protein